MFALAFVVAALGSCSKGSPNYSGNPPGGNNGGNNPYAVNIAGFAFSSASLTVPSGTSVTWKNMDNVNHTVTANDGSFDSGDIVPGATYSHTFSSVGSFSYHCKHHTYMTGKVTVQ